MAKINETKPAASFSFRISLQAPFPHTLTGPVMHGQPKRQAQCVTPTCTTSLCLSYPRAFTFSRRSSASCLAYCRQQSVCWTACSACLPGCRGASTCCWQLTNCQDVSRWQHRRAFVCDSTAVCHHAQAQSTASCAGMIGCWAIHLPLHALLEDGAQHLLHLMPLELQLLQHMEERGKSGSGQSMAPSRLCSQPRCCSRGSGVNHSR